MRTSIHLPDDLLARAKRKAASDGRTLTSLIEEGLRLVLGGSKGKTKGAKGRLPLSRHSGGLAPSVDLTRLSDLQDLDDVEYAERMRKGFR